jgi:glycosyltransferase involved in cell wall biosynthesis
MVAERGGEMTQRMLFITDQAYVAGGIGGGVQICTREFQALLRAAGFELLLHAVSPSRSLITRVKIRLGMESYARYEFETIARAAAAQIQKEGIRYVALNQINLAPLARSIRSFCGNEIVIVVLSHGNESGDVVHEIVKGKPRRGVRAFLQRAQLGSHLVNESKVLSEDVDCILCMSETEVEINRWLGARCSVFIPRVFESSFLDWHPDPHRLGFSGTLDHLPNRLGLEGVLNELERAGNRDVRVRVVGGPEAAGRSLASKYRFVDYLGRLSDDDLRSEAATWAFYLNPVLWFSRGASTKLAQAINWGLPVATTEAGNRGYLWADGRPLIASDAADMVRKLLDALSSPEEIGRLAQESRKIAASGPKMDELADAVREAIRGSHESPSEAFTRPNSSPGSSHP